MDHAETCKFGMNDSGTCEKIDTRLTQRRSPDVHPGCVYFIRVDDAIKIGFASNFKHRLGALQTSHERPLEVLAVISAAAIDEYETHQRFAHLRIRGEWFRAERELLHFIDYAKIKFGEAEPVQKAAKRPPAKKQPSEKDKLSALRKKYGAKSDVGGICSNLMQMIRNYSGLPEELRPKMQKNMQYQLETLANLTGCPQ